MSKLFALNDPGWAAGSVIGILSVLGGTLQSASGIVTISATANPAGPVAIDDEITITLSVAGWNAADGEVDAIDLKVDFDVATFEYVPGSLKATNDGTEFLAGPNQGAAYQLEDESDDGFAAAGRVLLSVFDANDFLGGSIGPSGSIGEFKVKAITAGIGTFTPMAANPTLVFSDADLFELSPTGGITIEAATVTVQAATMPVTYESWAATIPFGDPADALVDANPDGDLFLNLMEYALDLDPLVSDSEEAPKGNLIEIGGQIFLSLSYNRPSGDQERSDLTYTGQRSTELVNWSDAGTVVESVSAPDPITGLVEVTLRSVTPVSPLSLPEEFLRLVVIKQ